LIANSAESLINAMLPVTTGECFDLEPFFSQVSKNILMDSEIFRNEFLIAELSTFILHTDFFMRSPDLDFRSFLDQL
jgi:hypothetical protein